MIEIGSGIAIAGVSISAGAVAITAIRVFASNRDEKNISFFPCKEHSGIVEGIASIKKNQDRQEKCLETIAVDVKSLLKKV